MYEPRYTTNTTSRVPAYINFDTSPFPLYFFGTHRVKGGALIYASIELPRRFCLHIKCLLTSESTILAFFGATFGSYAVVCCAVLVEHYFGTGLDKYSEILTRN
ncbi:hypothetical protein OPV22_033869 [Ensete ventricosum]|uniref:Uncharacterized protein n=1 Tax=Ensete ventricosum TaxID=4639 RepID=A0AAV8PVF7_ENSVE|nr:hypothetical protein OPV22_033869 [Ensete ventricosum]